MNAFLTLPSTVLSQRNSSSSTLAAPPPVTTAAAIDRLVHHAIILELTGSSFRTDQAQGRQHPATQTETDPSMARATPSTHRAPETVTEEGRYSADVKM